VLEMAAWGDCIKQKSPRFFQNAGQIVGFSNSY